MELKIEHLSKRFKDKTAVNDVSLTLTSGVWGLLGANGAGKTTLMRMIADIMVPTNGAIYYDGQDIHEMGKAYRELFGFLPQDFGYSRDFTVKDYLEYGSIKGCSGKGNIKENQSSAGYSYAFGCEAEKDSKTIWRYETACRHCPSHVERSENFSNG